MAWPAAGRALAGPVMRKLMLGLGLLLAIGASGGVLVVAGLETWGRHVAGLDAAPGRSHDGLPLSAPSRPQGGQLQRVHAGEPGAIDRPVDTAGLSLRQGCAWGQPGRNPYRGSTEQALTAAGLPPEVVRQIAAQRQGGQKAGRLQISRDAIRTEDGSREFNPRQMAMSFGTTLCLNARVNFAPGHVEAADLFEARDDQGRLHAVMVPDVCGNVTVLGTRRAAGVVAGVSGALADRAMALVAVAEALASGTGTAALADPGAAAAGGAPPAEAQASGPQGGPAAVAGPAPDGGPEDAPGPDSLHGPGPLTGPGPATTVVASGPPQPGGSAGGETSTTPRDGRGPAWPGPASRDWARPVLVAGLNGSATVLARASTTLTTLAGKAGEQGGGGGGTATRQNTTWQAQQVPEPGTLLCVLAALAGLAWVGSRRR